MKIIIRLAVKDNTWEEPHIGDNMELEDDGEYIIVTMKNGTKMSYNKRYVISIKEYNE